MRWKWTEFSTEESIKLPELSIEDCVCKQVWDTQMLINSNSGLSSFEKMVAVEALEELEFRKKDFIDDPMPETFLNSEWKERVFVTIKNALSELKKK